MIDDLLPFLRCPVCRSPLALDDQPALNCRLGHTFRIVDGIPRFVTTPDDETAKRTQASFGYEWTHFNEWQHSGETNFNDYFEGIDLAELNDKDVLDAGCGMGRHARQVAPHTGRLVALDFSRAIDQAARNVASLDNVHCVQGDLLALPLADNAFDFIYSLGVLHHLDRTEHALYDLVAKLRAGGRIRIYLYWKPHRWQGQLLKIATAARTVTTRMPFGALRVCCWFLSVVLFALLIVPYRVLSWIGVRRHHSWPLFVYSKYPFNVIYNDQFDRFSAPIEKRYDPDEVRSLLEGAGLCDIHIHPCFGWVADGRKPA